MPVTVKEIATLAGVSIGTVDRVLHGRGRVSEETRLKIEEIVKTRDYRPNAIARHLKMGKEYAFGVLMPEPGNDEGYWALAMEGIKKAALEMRSFGVTVRIETFDRESEGSAMKALVRLGKSSPDGILAAPVDRAELGDALADVSSAMKCVFFDAEATGATPIASISQDPFKSGRLAGRLLDSLCPGKGADARRFALVNPHSGDTHLERRLEGAMSYFKDLVSANKQPEFIMIASEGDKKTKISRIAKDLATEASDLDGIFVANSQVAMTTGLLNPAKRPKIVGYDLVPENVAFLVSGRIDVLISQAPAFQAYEGLQALYRHVVLRENVTPSLPHAPLDVFFRENLPDGM